MDFFQDFLISLEDESKITGYKAAVAWNYDNVQGDSSQQPDEQFETADMSPAGVMGWLTGQKHRPLNGVDFIIAAKFDHECRSRNASHTICFPQVGACAKEITLPTAHMGTYDEFCHVFVLAFSKGQAFGRA